MPEYNERNAPTHLAAHAGKVEGLYLEAQRRIRELEAENAKLYALKEQYEKGNALLEAKLVECQQAFYKLDSQNTKLIEALRWFAEVGEGVMEQYGQENERKLIQLISGAWWRAHFKAAHYTLKEVQGG